MGLSIWKDEKYRNLQGTWPVIFLSFADVKANTFAMAREKICMLIKEVYRKYDFLLAEGSLKEGETELFRRTLTGMTDSEAAYSLKNLSGYLAGYYGKKVIILLDEYDTPLQEAWFVQFHVQDESIFGAGGYDGGYQSRQGIHFLRLK